MRWHLETSFASVPHEFNFSRWLRCSTGRPRLPGAARPSERPGATSPRGRVGLERAPRSKTIAAWHNREVVSEARQGKPGFCTTRICLRKTRTASEI